MTERQPWEIDPATLRDNATSARVARIWRRLEANAGSSESIPKRRLSLAWLPALAAGLMLGYLGGRQTTPPPVPTPSKLVAEPTSVEPAGPREQQRAAEAPETEPAKVDSESGRNHRARAHRVVPQDEPAESFDFSDALDSVSAHDTEMPQVKLPGPPPAPPIWLRLADRGDYERAYHSLEEYGGFDAVLLNASADELMVLVDVARATGNRGRAIQALRRVTESFVSDPNAPIAAMTLGRMLLSAGDRKGASDAFSLYRRLSPEGDFAEDALASDIQAAVEEGNWERAQMLARQYESDFPDGRHLEQIREQLNSAPHPDEPQPSEADDDGERSKTPGELDALPPVDSPYQ